jgi:hypothetical protein
MCATSSVCLKNKTIFLKRLLRPTRFAGIEEQIIPRSEQRSETSSTGGSTASEEEGEDRDEDS